MNSRRFMGAPRRCASRQKLRADVADERWCGRRGGLGAMGAARVLGVRTGRLASGQGWSWIPPTPIHTRKEKVNEPAVGHEDGFEVRELQHLSVAAAHRGPAQSH